MSVLDATSSFSCTSVNFAAVVIFAEFSQDFRRPHGFLITSRPDTQLCEDGWTAGHERREAEWPSIISSYVPTIYARSLNRVMQPEAEHGFISTRGSFGRQLAPLAFSTNGYSLKVRGFARTGRSTLHQVARSVPETKATGRHSARRSETA
ncbi:hypothetical protein BDZ85DRAFT_58529 [Elsinoe ampelina]|uniref:Uncharacterized protein n=1 Tax=Elsinoe ampelina TaxID=302913 RepID=A0A6A6GNA5_9PEZI|nr:hypothetical protein BDZ85DRAFT_58529 [Elsinoe ampelina]